MTAAAANTSAWKPPPLSAAADVVLLTVEKAVLRVLLLKRKDPPFKGRWGLPGAFVRPEEDLAATARRVLAEEARLKRVFLEQLYTFGEHARDPRTRVIAVAYVALVAAERLRTAVKEDEGLALASVRVAWEGEAGGPAEALDAADQALPLAFDHAEIVGMAVKRLRGKLAYAPIGYQLLPREFTLRELQEVHETILARPLNKDAFRRKVLASGEIEATGRLETQVVHRPAELYRFVSSSAV